MPVLRIAKLGNPILRQKATPVDPRDIRTYDLQQFIDDLLETMLDEPGIGLAAPQVSRSIQLVVMPFVSAVSLVILKIFTIHMTF